MKTNFLKNASLGKNAWWQYGLSILIPVMVVVLANMLIPQILPSIKSLFPDNDFGKNLGTYSLVFLIFILALITFILVASKLHKRPIMSFISTDNNFSWKSYFLGFLLWGGLLFLANLITDFNDFEAFLKDFDISRFWMLLVVGFVSIGIQSFFEELVIRGYWLQGLHLRIKNIVLLVLVNSLIFGVLHFGYGIESFLCSWTFGISFAVVVILQNRIEFVSGAHNANNLLLSLIFVDLSGAANADFSWSINWGEFALYLATLLVFTGLVYKFFRQ